MGHPSQALQVIEQQFSRGVLPDGSTLRWL